MEIFKTFGIDPLIVAAQIVNFLVILYILKRFLYPPLFKVLKERQDTIKEGLEKAEEGRKMLEESLLEEKKILKQAQENAKKILQDAKDQADVMLKTTEEKSKKQTERMLEEARVQIARDTKEAERRLTTNITELSVELLKKSLAEILTPTEQTEIIDRAIKKLKKRVD